jgi:hypothetical protein
MHLQLYAIWIRSLEAQGDASSTRSEIEGKHESYSILTSLQNEYLMHGVLLMASAHIRYLQPIARLYSDAEAQHLASTISGLRDALSEAISCENADIVTACSLILLHHAWSVSYSPANTAGTNTPVDIGSDNMLAFAAGLKSVLRSAWQVRKGSIFQEIINPNMVDNFKAWAITDSVSCGLEELFQGRSRRAWPEFREGDRACIELDCDLVDATDRLTPILRAAESYCRGVDMIRLSVEISQYLLLWPGKCDGTFRKAVQENDKEALLILLCFYLCTISLASNEFWWVRDRSKYMSLAISEYLAKDHNGYKETTAVVYDFFKVESRLL